MKTMIENERAKTVSPANPEQRSQPFQTSITLQAQHYGFHAVQYI
jgi:hypothetical protein